MPNCVLRTLMMLIMVKAVFNLWSRLIGTASSSGSSESNLTEIVSQEEESVLGTSPPLPPLGVLMSSIKQSRSEGAVSEIKQGSEKGKTDSGASGSRQRRVYTPKTKGVRLPASVDKQKKIRRLYILEDGTVGWYTTGPGVNKQTPSSAKPPQEDPLAAVTAHVTRAFEDLRLPEKFRVDKMLNGEQVKRVWRLSRLHGAWTWAKEHKLSTYNEFYSYVFVRARAGARCFMSPELEPLAMRLHSVFRQKYPFELKDARAVVATFPTEAEAVALILETSGGPDYKPTDLHENTETLVNDLMSNVRKTVGHVSDIIENAGHGIWDVLHKCLDTPQGNYFLALERMYPGVTNVITDEDERSYLGLPPLGDGAVDMGSVQGRSLDTHFQVPGPLPFSLTTPAPSSPAMNRRFKKLSDVSPSSSSASPPRGSGGWVD